MKIYKMHASHQTPELPRLTPIDQTHFLSLQAQPRVQTTQQELQMLPLPQGRVPHHPMSKQSVMPLSQFDLRARTKSSTSFVLKWNKIYVPEKRESNPKYSLTIVLRTLDGEVLNKKEVHQLSDNRHTVGRVIPNVQYMATIKSLNNPNVLRGNHRLSKTQL